MGDKRKISGSGAHSWTEPEGEPPEAVEEAPPLASGVVLAGRYQIHKVIGRGGMGVVVSAYDRTLGTTVAIKILRPEYAGERQWTERFAREVRLARQIHHPNVCRVFDFEQADGRVFLVMELARGGTLRSEIASGRGGARLPAERIADARAITEGLAAIHSAGVIHRDVTPSNVLRMADGRVVLSDFGLATDSFESTTNLRGGTIAYMAPEVVRGGALSYASDVWSLGAVIHEAVFGERPRWRDPAGFEMLQPELGRPLTSEERVVFETSRACTAVEPERRPASAGEVVGLLAGGVRRRPWRRWSTRGGRLRPMAAVGALVVVASVGMVFGRRMLVERSVHPVEESQPVILTGDPEDWTEKSRVLAEIPGRVACAVPLPDKNTVRFVWGSPPKVEDIDVRSGLRTTPDLAPESYSEGCPDTSPDGQSLVFQARAPDGRPFAFVSLRPDGRDASPMVPIAEPSMNSQPMWLPDGKSFSFDLDLKHAAIFSLGNGQTTVLPESRLPSIMTTFRWRAEDGLFVTAFGTANDSETTHYSWPSLAETFRLRTGTTVMDVHPGPTGHFLATMSLGTRGVLADFDVVRRTARKVGAVRGQALHHATRLEGALVFVSVQYSHKIVGPASLPDFAPVERGGLVYQIARCGQDFLTAESVDAGVIVVRRDGNGKPVARLTQGPADSCPVCSPEGRVWYFAPRDSKPGISRCEGSQCVRVFGGIVWDLAASPDGDRLLILNSANHGFRVQVMPAHGGVARALVDTESACAPGWSSTHTAWISRRRGAGYVWVEMDVDSGLETGRVVPGSTNCADSIGDPISPVSAELRVLRESVSQVRVLKLSDGPAGLTGG